MCIVRTYFVLHTIQVCSQTAYYMPEPTPTDRPLLNYGCVLYNVTKLSVTDMIHLMLALQQAPFHAGIENTGRHKQMSANLPLIHLLLKPFLRRAWRSFSKVHTYIRVRKTSQSFGKSCVNRVEYLKKLGPRAFRASQGAFCLCGYLAQREKERKNNVINLLWCRFALLNAAAALQFLESVVFLLLFRHSRPPFYTYPAN